MAQIDQLRVLLGNPQESNEILQFYLDNAKDIICDLRNSDNVESKYLTIQLKIAIELFNKRGAEGEVSHTENGIARAYSSADISNELLNQITPMAKSPFGVTRVVTQ